MAWLRERAEWASSRQPGPRTPTLSLWPSWAQKAGRKLAEEGIADALLGEIQGVGADLTLVGVLDDGPAGDLDHELVAPARSEKRPAAFDDLEHQIAQALGKGVIVGHGVGAGPTDHHRVGVFDVFPAHVWACRRC